MSAQLGVGDQLKHGVAKLDVITRRDQLLFDNAIKGRTELRFADIIVRQAGTSLRGG